MDNNHITFLSSSIFCIATNLCNKRATIIIINKPIRKTDVDVVIVISLNTNKTGFEYRIDQDAIISKTIN